MKILVLGGEGMLGHKMYQTLLARFPNAGCTVLAPKNGPFLGKIDLFRHGIVHDQVDAMDHASLGNTVRAFGPDVVVNCVGIIKQRPQARDAIPSITLNSLLPHRLAELVGEWGGRVIHFSTDCVFSGSRGRYSEDDPSDAEDLYGRTKYLGEVATPNALTLRTSIIGRELSEFRSLLEWLLAQRGRTVKGYTRVIYSGVTTNHLAHLVADLVQDHPALSGLYQVTAPPVSKHDLLCMLRDKYRLEVQIVPDDGEVSDRSMTGQRFLQATGYREPAWSELVDQLASDPTPYEKWR